MSLILFSHDIQPEFFFLWRQTDCAENEEKNYFQNGLIRLNPERMGAKLLLVFKTSCETAKIYRWSLLFVQTKEVTGAVNGYQKKDRWTTISKCFLNMSCS